MSNPTEKTTIHALFIGIDDYNKNIKLEERYYYPPLSGCVADVMAVKECLKNDPSLNLNETMLLNEDATKANIVAEFEALMRTATKDDVVLIYYSGHGTVEIANKEVWTSEYDGRLEGIVCYYDQPDTGKFFLSDKELRYLLNRLWSATRAHIVTIFDSCHSGDNTRSVVAQLLAPTPILSGQVVSKDAPVERRIDHVFKQRNWSDFIFAKAFSPQDFVGKHTDTVLLEGQYIQLSAAESNEAAIEQGGHGVFTAALLDILEQSGGFLSYNDLNARLRNKLYYQYAQRPKIYAPDDAVDLKKTGFLKKGIKEAESYASLTYNSAGVYRINRGISTGVQEGMTQVAVHLTDGQTVVGTAQLVVIDVAEVVFKNSDKALLRNKDYRVQLSKLATRPVRMRIVEKEQNSGLPALIAQKLGEPDFAPYTQLTLEAKETEYDIVLWRGKIYITRPNDTFRPLVDPLPIVSGQVSMVGKNSLDMLFDYLKHISRWHFLSELKNKGSNVLPDTTLKIDIFTIDNDVETPLLSPHERATLDLKYDATQKNKWRRNLKVKITNNSDKDLYIAGILNSDDFSVDTSWLQPQGVQFLEAGNSYTFFKKERKKPEQLPLVRDQSNYWYNWAKETLSIKILYSDEQFQNDAFNLQALDKAYYPQQAYRGVMKGKDEDPEDITITSWSVLDYPFYINNPTYNKVTLDDIQLMLKEPRCADFAEALYTVSSVDAKKPFDSNHRDLAGIATQEGEKGLRDIAIDVANSWATSRRKAHYRDMCQKFPTRPKLVSEGDSWFQHPLMNDIIDNIGAYLPISCIASAGDTIANYVKTGEFSAIIEAVKPVVFLLSGGGNDILGESMRGFLVRGDTNMPEGEHVDRFLNANYNKAISDLEEFYRTIFDILGLQQPDLKVLIHGYDYVRPLPPGSTKKSWLGKYFDEFGIIREGDRKTTAKYMIDGFNELLAKLAAEYVHQVTYIDLRGIVADDEWYDEIHPNDVGFQKVSLRFIRKLAALLGQKNVG